VQASFKGLIDGNPGQVATQLLAVAATIAYAVVATFVIVKVVDLILGIRISAKEEELGIDLAVHGEVAYQA
jgi:Amt family ammonium transporter